MLHRAVCLTYTVAAACLASAGSVYAEPIEKPLLTRASGIVAFSAGMGTLMHMSDYLAAYKGSRTAIFAYIKMDDPKAGSLIRNFGSQARIQSSKGREFWPQVSLETKGLPLDAFIRELSRPGSVTQGNVRLLARTIAACKAENRHVFVRPFSEMNDGTDFCPWEFAHKRYHNTPAQFAAAWKLLRDTFDSEGATNALFIFSPLAAYSVHHERETVEALNLIPPGYIDIFGLNVYSRPMTAYGGSSPKPVAFDTLVTPWLQLVQGTKHRGIPYAVSEMAVSNQAADVYRSEWLRYAFRFARTHGFIMATYFNYPHRYWSIDPNSVAGWALAQELNAP